MTYEQDTDVRSRAHGKVCSGVLGIQGPDFPPAPSELAGGLQNFQWIEAPKVRGAPMTAANVSGPNAFALPLV
jgi:hypothetical protein